LLSFVTPIAQKRTPTTSSASSKRKPKEDQKPALKQFRDYCKCEMATIEKLNSAQIASPPSVKSEPQSDYDDDGAMRLTRQRKAATSGRFEYYL
jgi:hypothetical protein